MPVSLFYGIGTGAFGIGGEASRVALVRCLVVLAWPIQDTILMVSLSNGNLVRQVLRDTCHRFLQAMHMEWVANRRLAGHTTFDVGITSL